MSGFRTAEDQYKFWGLQFGYPDCCIDEFIRIERTEKRKLHGTGYRPCTACNSKSESELIELIQGRRTHIYAFPEDR